MARNLVEPMTEGRTDGRDLEEMTRTVQRLRPVAMEVVRPFIAEELRRATEEALADFGARLSAGTADDAPPASSG